MAESAVGKVLILAVVIGVQAQNDPDVINNNIPKAAQSFCKVNMSTTTYSKDPLTKTECEPETLEKWTKLKKHGAVEAGGGTCTIDHVSKQMHCTREKRCEVYSGHTDEYNRHRHTTELSYDCKKACGNKGGLLNECCKTCDMLKANPSMLGNWKGYAVQSVDCLGCTKKDLAQAEQTDPNCEIKNGVYHCETSASCEIPPPAPGKDFTEDYSCETQTCSACDGDIQAKALCCINCLTRLCGDPTPFKKTRLACLGCGDDIPQNYRAVPVNQLSAQVPVNQPVAQALPTPVNQHFAQVPVNQPVAQALPSTFIIMMMAVIFVMALIFVMVAASRRKPPHDDYQSFNVEEAHVVE